MNDFIEAWKDAVMKNYANFAGRLSIGGYWRFVAINVAVAIVLYILVIIASIFYILLIIFWLGLIVPSIAAAIRRLHDTDKPGVYVLVGLVPCVGLILLYWLTLAGTPGDNQYGPQPAS